MESNIMKHEIERLSFSLAAEIYRIFEERDKIEEIPINVAVNDSRYTKISVSKDEFGLCLDFTEEYTESDGETRIYHDEIDFIPPSALIEIYNIVSKLS